MLKQLIDDVRANSELCHTSLWYYRISGNILECSVHPSYHHNRKEYRSAVISVGEAILAVSKKLDDLGLLSLIQSFPSLGHPELIASVRYYERTNSDKSIPARQEIASESIQPARYIDLLSAEARRLDLSVQSSPGNFTNSSSKSFKPGIDQELFLLTSRFDNPFCWLKIGYWKENTSPFAKDTVCNEQCKTDFIRFYDAVKQTEDPLQNRYVQAGIYLAASAEKVVV